MDGVSRTGRPGGRRADDPGTGEPGTGEPGTPAAGLPLPVLPGFREMALRRMSAQRQRLISDLAAQRQAAGLSQTEVAARMGTSQSAVARLEAGEADLRISTLERYAAAVGSQLTWRLQSGPPPGGPGAANDVSAGGGPGAGGRSVSAGSGFGSGGGASDAARPGDPGGLSHPGGGSLL